MSAMSGFCEKCNGFRKRYCDGDRNTCMSILFDTIEALQQENEKLKATLADWKYNAKCDADHITALTAEKDELVKVLKQARESLQAAWEDDGSTTVWKQILEIIKAIDALMGGKKDVTSMGD